MTLETLYRKYLKLMARNSNPYSFLELLSAEGKIPGFGANPVLEGGLNVDLPSFETGRYTFFDLMTEAGAMIKLPKKVNPNTQAVLRQMAEMLSGAANDNLGGGSSSSGTRAA